MVRVCDSGEGDRHAPQPLEAALLSLEGHSGAVQSRVLRLQ